jgi:hypothetical protein
LKQLLALRHSELRDLPPDISPALPSEARALDDVAQVLPVPERYRQRVHCKWYALWVNLIGLIPGVFFFGGGALLAGGIWLATTKEMPLGWIVAAVSLPAFLWGAYLGLYCPCLPENRWINRRLRREIGLRPDFLVDPRNAESLYVSLIPRDSFVKIKLTLSSDLLLLKLDAGGRRLLMEGDCDRYWIPCGAIAVCEPQCFYHPIDHQRRIQIWVVRLMVQFESGVRELLLSDNLTGWNPMTNKRRRKAAQNLCARIAGL